MKTRIQKWGNSLAIRIPKSIAAAMGLQANGAVDLSVVKGSLVVTPVRPPALSLRQLLRGITKGNVPDEWDTGRPLVDENS